mmetsp:Transcript_31506/g.74878  ORF Transcript_31506/g.74878 Transcript_31506/m.74878 type:complete len:327 (-) Transcript_31506:724-1704(-)
MNGHVITTPGPRLIRKALKSRYSASMFPMMMFGGSPIIVAVPPRFEKIASEMRYARGSMLTSLHSLQVTGQMRRMVVTLSRKAESTAVTRQRRSSSFVLSPPENLHAITPVHSKTPVRMVMPTISIMPQRSPRVPWSIQPTTLVRDGARFCIARMIMHIAAPIIAAIVRCSTSVMMRPKTIDMMIPAITTCMGPSQPRECSAIATARGSSESDTTTKISSSGDSLISNSRRSASSSVRISCDAISLGFGTPSSLTASALKPANDMLLCFHRSSPGCIRNTQKLTDFAGSSTATVELESATPSDAAPSSADSSAAAPWESARSGDRG